MPTTTISSRDFNHDTAGAKKAARRGPVIITDRGEPAHVLLTIEDYRRLCGTGLSLAAALAAEGQDEVDFTPPRLDGLFRSAGSL